MAEKARWNCVQSTPHSVPIPTWNVDRSGDRASNFPSIERISTFVQWTAIDSAQILVDKDRHGRRRGSRSSLANDAYEARNAHAWWIAARVHEESHGAALRGWILLVCEENVRHEILFHSTHATTPLHHVFRPSCAPRRPVFFRVPRRRCFFLFFFFFACWEPLRMMEFVPTRPFFAVTWFIHSELPSIPFPFRYFARRFFRFRHVYQ